MRVHAHSGHVLSEHVQWGKMENLDKAILRRILFVVEYLPADCPDYWEVVAKFAALGSATSGLLSPQNIRIFTENLQLLDAKAFASDLELKQELQSMSNGKADPLGIVLVSKQKKCIKCGGKLLVRNDRPSRMTIIH